MCVPIIILSFVLLFYVGLSTTQNTRCSNVPRNFLNEEHCVLSTELDACQAGETPPDIPILLDENNIKSFTI